MLGKLQPDTIRNIVILVATIVANSIASNFIWWLLGSVRSRVRTIARVAAAFLAILNLGLAMVCLFRMLRLGPDWFYILMLLVALIFAYRIGGATRGQYN
ncbi:MAG: hypothetical protein HY508_14385 [Acidobacteria bacterium]|nr:hypothetical protein [Acidobacteriota bacterium]